MEQARYLGVDRLSLSTCLQLFAHIRALQTRPGVFIGKSLLLRNGLLGGDVRIRIDNIEKRERASKFSPGKDVLKRAFIAGLEKPFGIAQSGRILLLHVDRRETFFAHAETLLQGR